MPNDGPREMTPQEAIMDYIGPGSATKSTLIDVLGDEYSESEIKHALADLISDGTVEEHPEIDGAWRRTDV